MERGRVLASYSRYYNETRTHLGLDKDSPLPRTVRRSGSIVSMPVLPDCIIAMFGYDFREGQASCAELLADSLLSLPTGFTPMRNSATEMWHSVWKPLVIVLPWTAIVLVVLYIIYRLVDPLPPRYLAIAAGMEGSGYDNFARQYARVLARQGVELQTRNSAGAVENS